MVGSEAFLLVRAGAGSDGGGVLVGGARKFCITPAIFEIRGSQDCSGRGFGEQGFAMTPAKGMSGAVVHIGPAGLVK